MSSVKFGMGKASTSCITVEKLFHLFYSFSSYRTKLDLGVVKNSIVVDDVSERC